MVVAGRRVSTVHIDSAFCLVMEALDQLEASGVELAVEREMLAEAWKLFHAMVERGHHENVAAHEEHAAALNFTADICDSAIRKVEETLGPLQAAKRKVDVDREALEAEVASKHQELDACEKQLVEAT